MTNYNNYVINNFETLRKLKDSGIDEVNTREKVIIEMIKNLEWDFLNSKEVVSEYQLSNGEKIDFVIMKDKQAEILIEVKKISSSLEFILTGQKIEKYKRQLKEVGGEFLIITNGLSVMIFVNDYINNDIIRCSNIEFNFYNKSQLKNSDMSKVMRFFHVFNRNNYYIENIYSKLVSEVSRNQKLAKLSSFLIGNSKELVNLINDKTGLKRSFIKKNLAKIIDADMAAVNLITHENSFEYLPLKGDYGRLARKMTGNAKGNIRWRRNQFKYKDVWEVLYKRGMINSEELNYLLDQACNGPQGKGSFIGYYIGSGSNTPILVEEEENVYKINPKLINAFDVFYSQMLEENEETEKAV